MPLDLLKRSESASALTASQHDANFTAIENTVNGLEQSVAGKAAQSHTHSAADIVSGLLEIARGGTGGGTPADALTNLLPTQVGQTGKFLMTNGSVVSWSMPAGGGGGSVSWGAIIGTLANQTDLNNALNARQPGDPTLTALAALVVAANQMIYATGPDAFATATLTAFARTLLDDADAAAMRATIGALAHTDLGGAKVGNYRVAKRQFGSQQTLNTSTCKGGETIVYTGTGHTWTLPQRLGAADTDVTETIVIRNRGSDNITLSASGVTIRGATVIPVGKSGTLEWETNGTTHWVWVDVN